MEWNEEVDHCGDTGVREGGNIPGKDCVQRTSGDNVVGKLQKQEVCGAGSGMMRKMTDSVWGQVCGAL